MLHNISAYVYFQCSLGKLWMQTQLYLFLVFQNLTYSKMPKCQGFNLSEIHLWKELIMTLNSHLFFIQTCNFLFVKFFFHYYRNLIRNANVVMCGVYEVNVYCHDEKEFTFQIGLNECRI